METIHFYLVYAHSPNVNDYVYGIHGDGQYGIPGEWLNESRLNEMASLSFRVFLCFPTILPSRWRDEPPSVLT